MSAKSLRNQLLAAIAMVLVATIALGSSTYAWFASNNVVNAEGMQISAQSEGANLEISWTSTFVDGTTTVNASSPNFAGVKAEALYPTHYVTGNESLNYTALDGVTAGKWIHTFSQEYANATTAGFSNTAANCTVVDPYGTGTTPASTEYAMVVPVYLRLNPNSQGSVADIKATATITESKGDGATADGMVDAGRVAYIVDGNLITNGTPADAAYKTGVQSAALGTVTASDADPLLVYVVVYFDGEDPSCTSEKFAADKFSVNITFEGTIENHNA